MIDWRPRIEALAKEQQADEQAIIAAGDDSNKIAQLSRSMGERSEMLALGSKFLELTQELEKVKELEQNEKDPEMLELVRSDAQRLGLELEKCDAELYELVMPKDPDDSRNVVLEVRAGTGGEEAALFASDLFALYLKYADLKKWRTEVVDFNATELEGCRDATLAISGKNVYGTLKYESGVHRVQRVPKTESQGRVHTSAASVMVLPEAEQVDIQIDDKDLRIDRYRAQGAGGQHVNRTDSAVRITHLPTGIVAQCQDNKSQHRNRDQAMRVMRARVYELARSKEANERLEKRRSLIKSGDRSQRIRTFNFPQNRITDHRINFTTRKLDRVLETGDLGEIIDALKSADRQGAESLQTTGD